MQDNWSSMLEQMAKANEQAVLAATELNKIATRTQGLLARKQLQALQTCLEAGTAQLALVSATRDPKGLVEAQTRLAAGFGEKWVATAQESLEIQAQARNDLARWFESGLQRAQSSMNGATPAPAAKSATRRALAPAAKSATRRASAPAAKSATRRAPAPAAKSTTRRPAARRGRKST